MRRRERGADFASQKMRTTVLWGEQTPGKLELNTESVHGAGTRCCDGCFITESTPTVNKYSNGKRLMGQR